MNLVTLTISYNPQTGQIAVNGPLDQKVLCYGLLEAARDTIKDLKPQPGNGLTLPHLQIPPNVLKKG